MAKKSDKRKFRTRVPRHGRAANYCGGTCDLDKGHVCEECKEFRRMRREGKLLNAYGGG